MSTRLVRLAASAQAQMIARQNFSRETIAFKVLGDDQIFTVHESLACDASQYFHQKVWANRKPITGICSICRDDFQPGESDIAFCRAACGNNFHHECVQPWLDTSETCPLCREDWVDEMEEVIEVSARVDVRAAQVFVDWLYTGKIDLVNAVPQDPEAYGLVTMGAWILASSLRAQGFTEEVYAALIASVYLAQEDTRDTRLDKIFECALSGQGTAQMRRFAADLSSLGERTTPGELLSTYAGKRFRFQELSSLVLGVGGSLPSSAAPPGQPFYREYPPDGQAQVHLNPQSPQAASSSSLLTTPPDTTPSAWFRCEALSGCHHGMIPARFRVMGSFCTWCVAGLPADHPTRRAWCLGASGHEVSRAEMVDDSGRLQDFCRTCLAQHHG
ncbi:hypothetical protein IQ07DRAFT_676780 [Pyrenochaeta sp. DS3sAY3a]|nr:hypothetical protein IQ07DRAFT_676780 [Pyrenochaeta sp. DS3sAY3a]